MDSEQEKKKMTYLLQQKELAITIIGDGSICVEECCDFGDNKDIIYLYMSSKQWKHFSTLWGNGYGNE